MAIVSVLSNAKGSRGPTGTSSGTKRWIAPGSEASIMGAGAGAADAGAAAGAGADGAPWDR